MLRRITSLLFAVSLVTAIGGGEASTQTINIFGDLVPSDPTLVDNARREILEFAARDDIGDPLLPTGRQSVGLHRPALLPGASPPTSPAPSPPASGAASQSINIFANLVPSDPTQASSRSRSYLARSSASLASECADLSVMCGGREKCGKFVS
jgi:hypothetical protein